MEFIGDFQEPGAEDLFTCFLNKLVLADAKVFDSVVWKDRYKPAMDSFSRQVNSLYKQGRADNEKLKKENQNLRFDNKALLENVRGLENCLRLKSERVSCLEKTVHAHAQRIEEVEQEMQEQHDTYVSLVLELENVKECLESREEQLTKAHLRQRICQNEIESLEKHTQHIRHRRQEMWTIFRERELDIGRLEKDKKKLEEECSGWKKKFEDRDREIDDLKVEIGLLQMGSVSVGEKGTEWEEVQDKGQGENLAKIVNQRNMVQQSGRGDTEKAGVSKENLKRPCSGYYNPDEDFEYGRPMKMPMTDTGMDSDSDEGPLIIDTDDEN